MIRGIILHQPRMQYRRVVPIEQVLAVVENQHSNYVFGVSIELIILAKDD
jgi:hypothetical protein